jgi:hypothetical protein
LWTEYQHQILGYECPIKNVTGNANVKIQNKNLAWNGWAEDCVSRIDNQYAAKITVKDDRNCLSFTANAGFGDYAHKYIFKTDFKENTQYTFAFDILSTTSNLSNFNMTIYYTDGTNTPIVKVPNNNWNKFVITSAPNKTIKYVTSYYTDGTRYLDLDTFMVLEGTYTAQTIPDYVPHQEQNLPFTFEEGQRGMQGTTLEDDGIHNAKKQVIFDGSNDEQWILSSSSDVRTAFKITIANIESYTTSSIVPNLVSSHFIAVANNTTWKPGIITRSASDGSLIVCMQPNITIEQFRTWLSNNPVTVEYKLVDSALEDNIIPYNSTQQEQYNAIKQARSYDDITYITSTSDEEGFDMKVTAIGDANKIMDNFDTRLLSLESEV